MANSWVIFKGNASDDISKETTYLYSKWTDGYSSGRGFYTNNKINLTGWDYVKAEVDLKIGATALGKTTMSIDVSSISAEKYINLTNRGQTSPASIYAYLNVDDDSKQVFGDETADKLLEGSSYGEGFWYNVWLEKEDGTKIYLYEDGNDFGFTNPTNIYASDDTYTTLSATSGVLTVEVSKDAGVNWQIAKTVTFDGSEATKTCGDGSSELWGTSWTRANMTDANFRVRLSHGHHKQIYKTFGFTTGTEILTGVEVAIEGKYAADIISLDNLKIKIYYGTSALPVQAGSQAYATDGRKTGEGEGAGTGVLVVYDGTNWNSTEGGVVDD
jgi:hypothetical protein